MLNKNKKMEILKESKSFMIPAYTTDSYVIGFDKTPLLHFQFHTLWVITS